MDPGKFLLRCASSRAQCPSSLSLNERRFFPRRWCILLHSFEPLLPRQTSQFDHVTSLLQQQIVQLFHESKYIARARSAIVPNLTRSTHALVPYLTRSTHSLHDFCPNGLPFNALLPAHPPIVPVMCGTIASTDAHSTFPSYDYGVDRSSIIKRQSPSPYVVTGIPTVKGGTTPLRLEVRQLEQDPTTWTLYILGLDMLQYTNQTQMLSWYQITGLQRPLCFEFRH